MGKGGSSKSATTTNNTNVSGQNAIQGDNLGVSLAGVNNSTVTVTGTDYGALERADKLVQESMDAMKESAAAAVQSNQSVSEAAINGASDNLKQSLAYAEAVDESTNRLVADTVAQMGETSKHSIESQQQTAFEAMRVAESAAQSGNDVAKLAIAESAETASDVMKLSDSMSKQNTDVANTAMASTLKASETAMLALKDGTQDTLQSLSSAISQAGVTARAAISANESITERSQTGDSQDIAGVAKVGLVAAAVAAAAMALNK